MVKDAFIVHHFTNTETPLQHVCLEGIYWIELKEPKESQRKLLERKQKSSFKKELTISENCIGRQIKVKSCIWKIRKENKFGKIQWKAIKNSMSAALKVFEGVK